MEKETILVRVTKRIQIKELIKDLIKANVSCQGKLYKDEIYTRNIRIKCVSIPVGCAHIHYVKGMRAVGCFGFDMEAENYLTKGNNVCKDYNLIDYVKDMDEMGY